MARIRVSEDFSRVATYAMEQLVCSPSGVWRSCGVGSWC